METISLFETLSSPGIVLDRYPPTCLEAIGRCCFADVPRLNTVEIAYGKSWKRRLGSIRLRADGAVSRIALNGLLSCAEVPVVVLVATIAHETFAEGGKRPQLLP